MIFPDVDWTPTYETACIAAVEAYIADIKRHQPETLHYRGLDLTGALERQLYFSLMHEPALHYLYACGFAGKEPHPQRISPELLGAAGHLVAGKGFDPKFGFKGHVDRILLRAPRLARLLRYLKHRSGPAVPRRPILAAVHHPKFVRYLRPIAAALPGQISFLIANRDRSASGFPVADDEWGILPVAAARREPASKAWPALCVWADEIAAVLDRVQPACILCVEGDAAYHEIIAGLARHRGIVALGLQWGAFPYRDPRSGFRRMGYDAFLSWGEGFTEQLRPFNPALRFRTVGNHMIDPRPSAPRRRLVFLMQGVDKIYISARHWQDFLSFTAWTAARYPEREIIVRSHPSVALTADETAFLAKPNVRFHDPAQVALRESLDGAVLAVTIISSAILEAVAQGVVPFLFNPTEGVQRFKPDFAEWDAGIECKNLADAQREMASLFDVNDDGALARFRPGLDRLRGHFFAAAGPIALDRIVSLLRTILAEGPSVIRDEATP